MWGDADRPGRQLIGVAAQAFGAVAELIFPPVCAFCGTDLIPGPGRQSNGTPALCDECLCALRTDAREACFRCGQPIGPHLDPESGCVLCQRRTYRFQEVIRLSLYLDKLREAVIRGKKAGTQPLSAALAEYLWQIQQQRLQAAAIDLVASVPQFWLKRVVTSHHQAETIAEVLGRRLHRPCRRHLIRKVRHTPDQSDLPRDLRVKNLANAFQVTHPELVRGKTVLLADDVLTTGTTVDECAHALKQAGAKRVVVAVIAVVS